MVDIRPFFVYYRQLRSFPITPDFFMENRRFGYPGPARQVALFVDWMNLWLIEDDMYAGNLSARQLLVRIIQQAQKLGREVHGVVYLNIGKLKERNSLAWTDLQETAKHLGLKVIDVPLQENGRDNVDAVMIEDMRRLNRHPDQSVRFALVTADRHFIPVVDEIRERRGIYLIVPTNVRLPSIARHGTDWHWVDWVAWRHMGVYDALSPHDVPGQSYLNTALERWRSYRESFQIVSRIARSLFELPDGLTISELMAIIKQRNWQCQIPDDAWDHYQQALEFYELIYIGSMPEQRVTINRFHRAVRAPSSPSSKPLPEGQAAAK